MKLFQIRTNDFRGEDFQKKKLLKKFHLVAMATRVFDGLKFCEHVLKKKTTQGTFLSSLVQIGPAV